MKIEDPLGESTSIYYGCLKRLKRPFRLFEVGVSSHVQDVVRLRRLAGPYAGVVVRRTAVDGTCFSTIGVYDLRRGRKIHDAPATSAGPAGTVCQADAAALVLTRFGGAAWVTAPNPAGVPVVRKVDRAGGAILDSGDIAMGSLMLSGAIVSWTKAGQRQSATLR